MSQDQVFENDKDPLYDNRSKSKKYCLPFPSKLHCKRISHTAPRVGHIHWLRRQNFIVIVTLNLLCKTTSERKKG